MMTAQCTELVLDHGNFLAVVGREDVVDKGCLASSQEACHDRDRESGVGLVLVRHGAASKARQ